MQRPSRRDGAVAEVVVAERGGAAMGGKDCACGG